MNKERVSTQNRKGVTGNKSVQAAEMAKSVVWGSGRTFPNVRCG